MLAFRCCSALISLAADTKAKRNTLRTMSGFLPLLNSGFHWDNGATKWQPSSERREERGGNRVRQKAWEKKRGGVQAGEKSLKSLDYHVSTNRGLCRHVLRGLFWIEVFRRLNTSLLKQCGLRQVV